MPLPVSMPRTMYHPDDEQKKASAENIRYIVDYLNSEQKNFSDIVWDDLAEAIRDDNRVGREFDSANGSLYKRIQKYFWNKYDFNFVTRKGAKIDALEASIQKCREDSLRFPIEAELSQRMDWTAGDFGDGDSCYFGGNTCTRRFMNTQENFRTLKVYKDGNNFGRALILTDVAGEGFHLLYNTYPGRNDKYKDMFAHALIGLLREHTGVEYLTKLVSIENRSKDTGWFYTNENIGAIVYPAAKQADGDATSRVILAYGDRPNVRELQGYVSDCVCCSKDADRKGTAIFDYDKYIPLPGTRIGAGICQKCSNTDQITCDVCSKKVVAVSYHIFNRFQVPGIATQVLRISDKLKIYVCNDCFDTAKHRLGM